MFGTDPRDGYFKGSWYAHPGLRFQLTFPSGWITSNQRQAVAAATPSKDAIVEVRLANEASADLAMRAFLSQTAITSGFPVHQTVHGLPAVATAFAFESDAGSLRGAVVCVEHAKVVFRLTAVATPIAWQTYATVAEDALASFAPLTDPAALGVQPQRLTILTLERRTTIAALARERPSPVTPATLALLNQVEADTPLEAGALVKWVVGQPPP
jgi:predicted Zn-dependent protease